MPIKKTSGPGPQKMAEPQPKNQNGTGNAPMGKPISVPKHYQK